MFSNKYFSSYIVRCVELVVLKQYLWMRAQLYTVDQLLSAEDNFQKYKEAAIILSHFSGKYFLKAGS
jgi:hypothetical protein